MWDLENSDPNDVSRPSVSTTDRRLFLAGVLALPLATIPANVELAEAQAAYGVYRFGKAHYQLLRSVSPG